MCACAGVCMHMCMCVCLSGWGGDGLMGMCVHVCVRVCVLCMHVRMCVCGRVGGWGGGEPHPGVHPAPPNMHNYIYKIKAV